jgi:hypothetical protein
MKTDLFHFSSVCQTPRHSPLSIYFPHYNILPWTISVIPVFMQMMLKSSDRYWRLSVLIKLCAYVTYTTLSESYVRFNKFFQLSSYCGSLQVLGIHFSVYFSRCHASNNYVEHHIWFFEVWLTFSLTGWKGPLQKVKLFNLIQIFF